jgi:hypothetical protein
MQKPVAGAARPIQWLRLEKTVGGSSGFRAGLLGW